METKGIANWFFNFFGGIALALTISIMGVYIIPRVPPIYGLILQISLLYSVLYVLYKSTEDNDK